MIISSKIIMYLKDTPNSAYEIPVNVCTLKCSGCHRISYRIDDFHLCVVITVATATFQGADVDWYIKADDIVLKNKNGQPAGNNHAPNNSQHKK